MIVCVFCGSAPTRSVLDPGLFVNCACSAVTVGPRYLKLARFGPDDAEVETLEMDHEGIPWAGDEYGRWCAGPVWGRDVGELIDGMVVRTVLES